jgi:hypothetical protein
LQGALYYLFSFDVQRSMLDVHLYEIILEPYF